MGFVNNYHFRASADKVVTTSLLLNVIERDNRNREPLKNRDSRRALAFESTDSAWQNQHRIQAELRSKLYLPLFCKVGWAQNAKPIGFATSEHFLCNQSSLNRLTNPDIIRN
jgi:hypothetical protein